MLAPLTAPQTKSFISVNARNVKMAHSAGRSNGVVADENEMESECVFLVGVARRGGTLMALQRCCTAEGGMSIGYEAAAAAEELTLVICFFE